jgi:hypothetical protein
MTEPPPNYKEDGMKSIDEKLQSIQDSITVIEVALGIIIGMLVAMVIF